MIGAPSFPLGAPNKRQVLLPGSTFLSGKLTKGLVGWWEFGVPLLTGTSVPDLSGNGNTGTLTNGPTKVAGRLGRALNFVPASNQYVAVGSNSVLNLTGNITIAAWINPASTGEATNGRIFDKKASTGGYGFILEGTLAANSLEFIINAASVDGSTFKVSNANVISMGVWQHVAVVYDSVGQTATFYVNGVNAGGGALTAPIVSASGTAARIGARSADNLRDFDGKINSVRVYNRTLSVGEIRQLSQTPLFQTAQPIDRIWSEITRLISTASLTQTIGNLTVASTGTVRVTGALSSTISNLTSSSAGTVLVTGALGSTIDNLTLSSTLTSDTNLTLNATIDDLTSSAAGTVLVSGAASATIDGLTSSSAGTVLVTGSLSETIADITSSSTGSTPSTASLSSTLGNLTVSSTGTALVTGTLGATIPPITVISAVGVGFLSTGTVVATIAPITSSSTGKVRVLGGLTKTIADLTSSSTGKVKVKAVLTSNIGNLTLAGHAINPALLPPNRAYIQIPQYNIDNPPPGDAETLAHVVLKLREMQHWFDMLSEAAVQPTQFEPINPKFGMMRYAIGQWAGTLGAIGLYVYKEGGWTLVV